MAHPGATKCPFLEPRWVSERESGEEELGDQRGTSQVYPEWLPRVGGVLACVPGKGGVIPALGGLGAGQSWGCGLQGLGFAGGLGSRRSPSWEEHLGLLRTTRASRFHFVQAGS